MGFIEKDGAKFWKEHLKKIMNEENKWDHMVEIGVVQGSVEKVSCNKVVEAMHKMKSGKGIGPSEASVEMIVASGEIKVRVKMIELCQQVLDGREMLNEWKTSEIVPIFKEKGDVMSCGSYRGVKQQENAMKIVEMVLRAENTNTSQFE